MHPILVLLRKDFAVFIRNRAAVALTFIVPFTLIALFGQIFGVNRRDPGPSGIPLAVVNASTNPAAVSLVNALKAEKTFRVITEFTNPDKSVRPLVESDLRPLMKANAFRFALVLPTDLLADDRIGLHLKFFSNPVNDIETQMANGMVQKTVFTAVPQLFGQSLQNRARKFLGGDRYRQFNQAIAGAVSSNFGGDREQILRRIESGDFGFSNLGTGSATTSATAANSSPAGSGATASNDVLSRLVRFDTEQVAGTDVKNPMATRLVAGWGIQFLLFAVSASATGLFYEKAGGLFQRLLASPATRAHILWSKFLYGVVLGLVQLMTLFLAGRLLFGVEIEHHLLLLALVCVFAAASCTAFGMLIASVAATAEAANGLSTMVILTMSAVGGAWFPTSIMPELMQHLSKFTLVYWSVEGFLQVLWSHASLTELLPTLGVLAAITAGVMTVALWRFNRGKIFE